MTADTFTSTKGTDPGWPFNRLVTAIRAYGGQLYEHNTLDGFVKAAKTECPLEHTTHDRGFWFAERPDGSVHAGTFCAHDRRFVLEEFGLEPSDLKTAPDGTIIVGTWKPPPLTDGGNAERLAMLHGANFRWVEIWDKHLVYDGTRWAPDTGDSRILRLARDVRLNLLDELPHILDPDQQKRHFRWAQESDNRGKLSAMVHLTRALPGVRVSHEELDTLPYLLNTPNGTLNLLTGTLQPHHPKDLLTKITRAAHVPGASRPTFTGFLGRILPDDEQRKLVQRLLGQALVGRTEEEILPVFWGRGANGKSKLLGAVSFALGEYAAVSPRTLLMAAKHEQHPTELTDLFGARLVAVFETEAGGRLDDSKMKWLTGGDSIRARRMREDFWEFRPTHSLVLVTNWLPQVMGTDDADWRRLKLVPFDVVIPDSEQDRQLALKLEAEAEGILAWLVEGYEDYRDHGLKVTEKTLAATARWRRSQDPFSRFMEDAGLVFDRTLWIETSKLLDEYGRWCDDNHEPPTRARDIAQLLQKFDCTNHKRKIGRVWYGIGKPSADGNQQDTSGSETTPDVPVKSSAGQPETTPPSPTSKVTPRTPAPYDQNIRISHENHAEQVSQVSPPRSDMVVVDRAAFSAVPVRVECEDDFLAIRGQLLDAPVVGFDLETYALGPFRSEKFAALNPFKSAPRLAQLAIEPGRAWVIDLTKVSPRVLQPFLDSAKRIIGQNLKFDLRHLLQAGLSLPADLGWRVRDTMLAAQLLDAGEYHPKGYHGLGLLVERELDLGLSKELGASDWSGELTEAQYHYAASDAAVLLPLWDKLADKLTEAALARVTRLENRAMPALAWLEHSGMPFDLGRLNGLTATAIEDRNRAEKRLVELAGKTINWNSPKQVLELFSELGILISNTNATTMTGLAADHEIAAALLEYRKASKRAGMYGEDFAGFVAEDGRIHADFRQIGARSGRMSCSGPNLQQVPKAAEYRECFRAPEGRRLVKADYSQIELRIAATIAPDQRLLQAYRDGEDVHIITARSVLGRQEISKTDRQQAKAVNFGLLYGMGPTKFRIYAKTTYGVDLTEEQATSYRDRFFETYPGLKAWHWAQKAYPIDTRTLAGRRRLQVKPFTEKVNSPVQGTGADGMKLGLALLFERQNQMPGAFPVHVVHDELVVECRAEDAEDAAAWVKSAMEHGMSEIVTDVPVIAEPKIQQSWAEED